MGQQRLEYDAGWERNNDTYTMSVDSPLHPDEVTDPFDLAVGKRIRCNYKSSPGQLGMFSGLGQETKDFIPSESSAAPDGDFYFICVDRDHLGRWKLIADRNIQHSISWDTLNNGGVASGRGVPIKFSAIPALSSDTGENGKVISSGYYHGAYPYYAWKAFDKDNSNNQSSRWAISGRTGYIGYEFNEPITINSYSLMTINSTGVSDWKTGMPKKWDFEASNDGADWIVLDSRANITDWLSHIEMRFTFNNKNEYKMYRLNIKENNGSSYTTIFEIEMYERKNWSSSIRLLTGGISSSDKDNEWDKYIVNSTLNNTIIAGDNNVWNWNVAVNTWTSTTISGTPANRVVRGYTNDISNYGSNPSGITAATTPKGFRPVLLLNAIVNKSFILFNGEYKKWNDTLWETISTTLPSEDIFINEGMDDLSVLDRRETTFVLDMNDSSGLGEEGKLFKAKVDLKKYIEITSLSVK